MVQLQMDQQMTLLSKTSKTKAGDTSEVSRVKQFSGFVKGADPQPRISIKS